MVRQDSNRLFSNLIFREGKTIYQIIKKINKQEQLELTVSMPPLIKIIVKHEVKELVLQPIPTEWIKKIVL